MSFLDRLGGGTPDYGRVKPGDEIVATGEPWVVRAVVQYRSAENEWPVVQVERDGRRVWTAVEDGGAVRYDPAPDLHLSGEGTIAWEDRLYVQEEAGTATVAAAAGEVDVEPGARMSYVTLRSENDPDRWLSVETWDSGWVEISIGQAWAVERIEHRS